MEAVSGVHDLAESLDFYDPAFLADAKKRRAPVAPISGEKLVKLVNDGLNVSPDLVAKMKGAFGFK